MTVGRTRWIDRPVRKAENFGAPLKCPKCPERQYYGWLWLPNLKSHPCPNCGTRLINAKKRE